MNYKLGKYYRSNLSGILMQFTGFAICLYLVQGELRHFVELSFTVIGESGEYVPKRPRSIRLAFETEEDKQNVNAFLQRLLDVTPSAEVPRAPSEDSQESGPSEAATESTPSAAARTPSESPDSHSDGSSSG